MANRLNPVGRLAVALAAWVTLSQGPAMVHGYSQVGFGKNVGKYSKYASKTRTFLYHPQSQNERQKQQHDPRRKDFEDRSVKYYRTVRRMDRQTSSVVDDESLTKQQNAAKELENEYRREFVTLAMQHYFALKKIKSGQLDHAERIYQKNIEKTVKGRDDGGHCDHETLAASTLLLALLKQRMGDIKGTRSVFVRFFRIVGEDEVSECRCSAKVLQAFALFEMKRGYGLKSYFLAQRAVSLDKNLAPVLKWKQFRDVSERLMNESKRQQTDEPPIAFVRP